MLARYLNSQTILQYVSSLLTESIEAELQWFEIITSVTSYLSGIELTIEVNGKLIGNIGLHSIDYINQVCGSGTIIGDKNHHNQGYSTDAKMHLLHLAFTKLNM